MTKSKKTIKPGKKAEDYMDQIRQRMWRRAGKDPKKWDEMIAKIAQQFCCQYGLPGCDS